tara:strand:- start:236 stop:394 length:159 start_codon:yes stop_codon:yes gene_type:complete
MSYEIEWDSVVESESESAKIEAIADIEEELGIDMEALEDEFRFSDEDLQDVL